MIDKYQAYTVYKNIKKMWNSKRFNTMVFRDFFDDTMENYVINQFVDASRGIEYMSNYFIKIVNEINCSFIDVEHWTMYVMEKCLADGKLPEPNDINSVSKLAPYRIFTKRAVITRQIEEINRLVEQRNDGIDFFTDKRFSLYDIDADGKNQAYKMYVEGKLDPEFYIQGLMHGKFTVDEFSVKDVEYRRFIVFCRMIIKLYKEISEKMHGCRALT